MTRKILITLILAAAFSIVTSAAQDRVYPFVFYNVENLFDTINSSGTYDQEFTPQGSKKWNTYRYNKKLENLEEVFYSIAQAEKTFPAIIGVAEVENRNVLEDLVSMPKLMRANYQIVHYDSPDMRGVDVALFYRPDVFKYEGSYPHKTVIPELPDYKTRDVLSVWGKIEDEYFDIFVCHWPSRLGGDVASDFKRVAAAQVIKNAMDSIILVRPDTKFVVMGDMNDDPTNNSMAKVLKGKGKPMQVKKDDMFNPFWQLHRDGIGTLAYQDAWNVFDNILISENLLNAPDGKLKIYRKNKYYGYIFNRPFLQQQSGQYKGYPLRTFVGDNFQGGYSDHFPVYILIKK